MDGRNFLRDSRPSDQSLQLFKVVVTATTTVYSQVVERKDEKWE